MENITLLTRPRIGFPYDSMEQVKLSTALCSAMFLVVILKWASSWLKQKRMPPGPKGLPWVGNKHQVPAIKPWRKFAEWNKQFGPVVSLFLGRNPVIILGTAQAAWDLLEKRSEIYSSRPRFVVAGEILSGNMRGLMLPYGEEWRKWRKVLHLGLHARRAETYKDIQNLESKIAMYQVLQDPSQYERHLQRFAASVVTSLSYGRRVDSVDEWIVKENMDSMDYLTSVNIPGKYLVESWPWLLKLPRPLQWFRREPELRRQRDIEFYMHLLNDVKARMNDGTIPDCMAVQTLNNRARNGMSELEVAYSVSSPFGAGIETTAGTLTTFVLAMLHFPEVMKKAQAEIDSIIGFDRMPEFEDKEQLSYVNALVNEALRWRPVAALGGTAHAVTTDDEYNGMFIPKGSAVFGNLFGIMHDPIMFPEPDTFRPERFLESTDPRMQTFDLPFGWGRRICPGMHLALNSLFINTVRLLWAFDILPALDDHGKEIIPDSMNYTNGFNSRPVSFDCRFIPRNAKIVDVIENDWEAAKGRLSGWQ